MKLTLARLSMALSLLIPVYFAAAALGVKFGLWPWQTGLGVLIVRWGPGLLLAALALGLVALVVAFVGRPRQGWQMALVGLLIPALGMGYLVNMRGRSADIPPIHDIATNIVDPPMFSARILAARQAQAANPVESLAAPITSLAAYQGARFASMGAKTLGQVGQEGYPAVRTLTLTAAPAEVMAAAKAQAEAEGWSDVTPQPGAGMIEATAETFWFGFKDDVVIRVRPAAAGGGSLVDVRSTSRVGLSDLGANAARIEKYLAGLSARTGKS